MGTLYKILDYQNKKIIMNLSAKEVCTHLDALFPAYTQSFAVVSNNDEFVTGDFSQRGAFFEHLPQKRPSEG